MLNNISEIYKFSHYFIDPNKFIFRKVVRILALVFLFIRNLKAKRNINSNLTLCSVNRLLNQFGNCKIMEDYSTISFLLAFVRFSCKVGYPKKLILDAGSQLIKGCQTMIIKFSNVKYKLHEEYGVKFETCPVGAHYMHCKVERKIRHVRESFQKSNKKTRLSIIQWETLGDQIANSINNMPIALGNIVIK